MSNICYNTTLIFINLKLGQKGVLALFWASFNMVLELKNFTMNEGLR